MAEGFKEMVAGQHTVTSTPRQQACARLSKQHSNSQKTSTQPMMDVKSAII